RFPKGDPEIEKLITELTNVRNSNGQIDLTSCSPRVRQFAHQMYSIRDIPDKTDVSENNRSPNTLDDLMWNQRQYFQLLDNLFQRLFGKSATAFSSPEDFIDKMKVANPFSDSGKVRAYEEGLNDIKDFYSKQTNSVYQKS